jgi:hypothetical protein
VFVLVLVLGLFASVGWMSTGGDPTFEWSLRIGPPALAALLVWAAWRASRRVDAAPDLLRDVAGTYFERDGFCFVPVVETNFLGSASVSIYFQNRYERPVTARVRMLPPRRSFRLSRHPVPEVAVGIQCPGGAFGVLRVPYVVPPAYRGRALTYDVAADAKYPSRRGKVLRARARGVRVGLVREMGDLNQAFTTLLLLPFGVFCSSRAASVTLDLPDGGGATVGGQPEFTILWAPGVERAASAGTPARAAA